jgi:plasmid stabilization system protein ParE
VRKIVWLDQAVDDLVRLRDFIGKKNKEAAKRPNTSEAVTRCKLTLN